MGRAHRQLKPAAIGPGLAAVSLAAGLVAAIAWPSPRLEDARSHGAVRRPALAVKDVRILTFDAPAPARVALAPDEWTSDAPAFQARLTHARLVAPLPSPPPLPPSPSLREQTTATLAPVQQAMLAAAPALALTQAVAKDESKICRNPAAPPPLRLSYAPMLSGRTMDIAPASPPPEQERRIRLSALLAQALQQ